MHQQQPQQHVDIVQEFFARITHHPIMRHSPEVRTPFLETFASLAYSVQGVTMVLGQMGSMGRIPGLEVLSFKKLFQTVLEYCVRYHNVLGELARAGGGMLGQPLQHERLMHAAEADILVAFLRVLK